MDAAQSCTACHSMLSGTSKPYLGYSWQAWHQHNFPGMIENAAKESCRGCDMMWTNLSGHQQSIFRGTLNTRSVFSKILRLIQESISFIMPRVKQSFPGPDADLCTYCVGLQGDKIKFEFGPYASFGTVDFLLVPALGLSPL